MMVVEKTLRTSKNAFGMWKYPIGRRSLEILGYRMDVVDRLPKKTVDQFVGVANPFWFSPPQRGERILCVECGTGLDLLYAGVLVGPEGWGEGIDLSPDLVREAEQAIRFSGMSWLRARPGNFLELDREERSFDRIVFNGSFYLFYRKREILERCRRTLKPGGLLQLADLLQDRLEHRFEVLTRDLGPGGAGAVTNENSLRPLLRDTGFPEVRIHRAGYRILPSTVSASVEAK